MRKISFLIAAHNEEKIIARTLKNLIRLPYANYEVILGLDGCTDGTEEIVKKFVKNSGRIRYYKLNLRNGKPAVINLIMKKARGEIIVIQDADWIFTVKKKRDLEELIELFDDEEVGGIAESFPVEWERDKLKTGNLTYKMVAYSSYFWMLFQKSRHSRVEGEISYVTSPTMFLTNIFRKKLYKPNTSLGDDFERTYDILEQGYKIAVLLSEDNPRMIAVYGRIRFKDFFRQKMRTAIARTQINKKGANLNVFSYYLPSNFFILQRSFRRSFPIGLLMLFWMSIVSFSTFLAMLKRKTTRQGWKLRAKR